MALPTAGARSGSAGITYPIESDIKVSLANFDAVYRPWITSEMKMHLGNGESVKSFLLTHSMALGGCAIHSTNRHGLPEFGGRYLLLPAMLAALVC